MIGVLAVGLVLAAALDECEACKPKKLCVEHAEREREVISEREPELESEDPAERTAALRALAALSEDHANAPSKEAARLLSAALEDESLTVRAVAAELLARGQDPETAVGGLVGLLEDIQRGLGRGDLVASIQRDESPAAASEAMEYLQRVLRAAGGLPDDRTAGALKDVLVALPWETRGQPLGRAAVEAVLELGVQDGVEAVIGLLDPFEETPEVRSVHEALATFARLSELEDPPAWGPNARSDWRGWEKRNVRRLPKRIGRMELPAPE